MPHLSASQLETFLQCPKKWTAQYIDSLRGEPSEALGLGGAFHETLENFGRWRLQRRSGTIDLAAMQREFVQILRKTLALQDPNGTLLKATDQMEQKGFAMLEAFCRDVAPIYWPVAVEESFEFTIPGMPLYNGEPWTMRGRIDARTALSSGEMVTIDWKSGKRWREGAEHSKLQATAYLLADLMEGRPVPAQVTFITFPVEWSKEDERFTCEADVRVTTRTLRQVSELMQTLRSAALQINKLRDANGVGVQGNPSYLCPWCPRYNRCYTGQNFMFQKGRLSAITVNENDQPLSADELAS